MTGKAGQSPPARSVEPRSEEDSHPEGEAELVARIRAGNPDAYAVLVERYQQQLYRYARGMGLDPDTASDMVQESFIRAYGNLSRFREDSRFSTWIHRILRNRCLDHLKSPRRNTIPLDATLPGASEEDPGADLERASLREALNDALSRLSDAHREAFLLKDFEGRSYRAMSEITGASISAMKMRVHRAREELRDLLSDVV